jgi:hypothetical protein
MGAITPEQASALHSQWRFQVLHLPGHGGFTHGVRLQRGVKLFAAQLKRISPDAITNVICALKDITMDQGEYWPTDSRAALRAALESELHEWTGYRHRCCE